MTAGRGFIALGAVLLGARHPVGALLAAIAKVLQAHRDAYYEIATANSGTAAMNALDTHAYDVVLTDLKMPDKSGFELLKEIRALNPEITVVIMTAFGTIEGAVAAMREGVYGPA